MFRPAIGPRCKRGANTALPDASRVLAVRSTCLLLFTIWSSRCRTPSWTSWSSASPLGWFVRLPNPGSGRCRRRASRMPAPAHLRPGLAARPSRRRHPAPQGRLPVVVPALRDRRMAHAAAPMRHLRLVSTPPKETEMAKTATTKLVRTDTPGVYKRGTKYTYVYRVEGRQRWGDGADPQRRPEGQAPGRGRRRPRADLRHRGHQVR